MSGGTSLAPGAAPRARLDDLRARGLLSLEQYLDEIEHLNQEICGHGVFAFAPKIGAREISRKFPGNLPVL